MYLQVPEGQGSSGRKITSKYFNKDKQKPKDEKETQELPAKRKNGKDSEELPESRPLKKIHKADEDEGDDDCVLVAGKKKVADSTPTKKLKSGSGRGVPKKSADLEEDDEDDGKEAATPAKSGGRGRGGRGASAQAAGGRGRGGGGRGGFMNFGERKDPPHKGEKVQSYQVSGSIL